MSDTAHESPSVKSRLLHELRRYAVISLYLFVCFAVVLIYEASQSADRDTSPLALGMAAVKALVLGKFILIGEALKPGTRIGAPTLLHRVAWRTLGLLVVLVILKLIEEWVVGMVHSRSFVELIAELREQPWIALLGPVLMMLLILVPMVVAIELDKALGEKGLKGLLLEPGQ